jgi:hypothetical protein
MTPKEFNDNISDCCDAYVLTVPKYQSYDMEDNPLMKICSKCKLKIKL